MGEGKGWRKPRSCDQADFPGASAPSDKRNEGFQGRRLHLFPSISAGLAANARTETSGASKGGNANCIYSHFHVAVDLFKSVWSYPPWNQPNLTYLSLFLFLDLHASDGIILLYFSWQQVGSSGSSCKYISLHLGTHLLLITLVNRWGWAHTLLPICPQECHRGSLAWDHVVMPEQQGLRPALWPHQERMRQRLCLFLLRVVHLPLLLPGKPVPKRLGKLQAIPTLLFPSSPQLWFTQCLLKTIYPPGAKIPLIPKETI